MMATLAIALASVWALGMLTAYKLNGFIHIFLLLSIIAVALRMYSKRKRSRSRA